MSELKIKTPFEATLSDTDNNGFIDEAELNSADSRTAAHILANYAGTLTTGQPDHWRVSSDAKTNILDWVDKHPDSHQVLMDLVQDNSFYDTTFAAGIINDKLTFAMPAKLQTADFFGEKNLGNIQSVALIGDNNRNSLTLRFAFADGAVRTVSSYHDDQVDSFRIWNEQSVSRDFDIEDTCPDASSTNLTWFHQVREYVLRDQLYLYQPKANSWTTRFWMWMNMPSSGGLKFPLS